MKGRCVRHVSGRGRFELEARPGCLVQAVTQGDEEQIVGAATWLLGGEGDPDAKAAWDLGAAGRVAMLVWSSLQRRLRSTAVFTWAL